MSQPSGVIDSLTKIINQPSTPDSTKIKLYGDISWSLIGTDINKSLEYAKKELDLSIRTGRKADIAQSYSDLGSIYNRRGEFDTALVHYYKALKIRTELNHDKKVAGIYSNIASVYFRQSKYREALDINFKSLKIFEKYNDAQSVMTQSMILGNIGNLYYELELNQQADVFFRRCLALARKAGDEITASNVMLNVGGILFERNELDSAEIYFLEAEKIMLKHNVLYNLAACHNDLGKLYVQKKKYDKALRYFKTALENREALDDKYGIALSHQNIGEIYLILGKPDLSINELNQCVGIFTESKNYLNLISTYRYLSEAYAAKKDYPSSLKFSQLSTIMKDSIYNQENSKKLTEMQVKYQTEKKEKENLVLQKLNTEKDLALSRRNNAIMLIGGLFSFALIISVFLYQRNKLKQKQILSDAMLVQQQMRNKAIIEAEEKERVRIARDLHDGVGQLLSAAKLNLSSFTNAVSGQAAAETKYLSNALNMIDDSVREVRSVSHNMMPGTLYKSGLRAAVEDFTEKINAAGVLKITTEFIEMDGRLDQTAELIIYRVLQELVSNCIRHSGATTLNIQMVNHGNELTIIVEDNGKGFDSSIIHSEKGIGLKNIISRIGFLGGTVDFDTAANRGTTVIIEIPTGKK